MTNKNTSHKIARILLFGSFGSFLLATFLSGFPILAFLWNVSFPATSAELSQVLATPIKTEHFEVQKEDDKTVTLPEKDESLPKEPQIRITKIGVGTTIREASLENFESALQQGVWRVPNFGTPTDTQKPMILVAHRFGYISWEQNFRVQNSFYNLPKLNEGDRIEVIWDQRKYEYEIYQKEEGENISHYSADLILYTCRFFNSDTRIFRYARKM